jgi:hypothetical protein
MRCEGMMAPIESEKIEKHERPPLEHF